MSIVTSEIMRYTVYDYFGGDGNLVLNQNRHSTPAFDPHCHFLWADKSTRYWQCDYPYLKSYIRDQCYMEMHPDGSDSEYVCTSGQIKCGSSLFKSLGLVGVDEDGNVKNESKQITSKGLEEGDYCEFDFTDLGYKQTNWFEAAAASVARGWSFDYDVQGEEYR